MQNKQKMDNICLINSEDYLIQIICNENVFRNEIIAFKQATFIKIY